MYNPNEFFTPEEIKKIRLFGISILNHVIPIDYKDHYLTSTGKMWDIDTYTYGAAKFLGMPEEEFLAFADLKRYDDNVMFSNYPLFRKLCIDFKLHSWLELKEVADFADRIFVVEAGRGIDVLLASLVKPWVKIEAYDQDKAVLVEMQRYFGGELGLPFKALQMNTYNVNYGAMNEKTIIFGTCHNLNDEIKSQILGNKNLLAILDGEILR